MSVWNGWRVVMVCLVVIGAATAGRAQTVRSKPTNEALASIEDGTRPSQDIHWPNGFHPEQADLFAHNEIVVHASCEKVFANIVDAPGVAVVVSELAQRPAVEQPGWKAP